MGTNSMLKITIQGEVFWSWGCEFEPSIRNARIAFDKNHPNEKFDDFKIVIEWVGGTLV
jgi:hypothetical protein